MFYLFTIITNKSCGPNYIYIIILSLCLNFSSRVYLFNVIILNIIIVILYTVFRHKTCHNKLSWQYLKTRHFAISILHLVPKIWNKFKNTIIISLILCVSFAVDTVIIPFTLPPIRYSYLTFLYILCCVCPPIGEVSSCL